MFLILLKLVWCKLLLFLLQKTLKTHSSFYETRLNLYNTHSLFTSQKKNKNDHLKSVFGVPSSKSHSSTKHVQMLKIKRVKNDVTIVQLSYSGHLVTIDVVTKPYFSEQGLHLLPLYVLNYLL